MLTNAYQAEYGRAVGGQLQVVTKSGSRSSTGRATGSAAALDWNANTWTNNRRCTAAGRHRKAIDKPRPRATTAATRSAARSSSPAFQHRQEEAVLLLQPGVPAAHEPAGAAHDARAHRARARGRLLAERRHQRQPVPYIRDYTLGLPCSATNQRGCFQDGGVLGDPANRLYAPGLAALNIYPQANYHRPAGGINFQSQDADNAPRREDLLRHRLPGHRQVARDGPLHEHEGRHRAGLWHDLGRQRQRPAPDADALPAPGLQLHDVDDGHPEHHDLARVERGARAHNSLNYELQNEKLFRSNSGLTGLPYLYPDAVQARLRALLHLPRRPHRQRRPVPDRPRAVHQREHHLRRGREPDQDLGTALGEVRRYYQNSYKPQSIFFSFNGQIDFTDNSSNPFDTGYSYANAATGVFNSYQQANKFSVPEWRYKNYEWYAQDNWKASSKLTLDYGVRFYYLDAAVGPVAPGLELPARPVQPSQAATLYTPVCIGAYPVLRRQSARHGSEAHRPGAARSRNTVEGRFIGRLTPDSNRFNGAYQAGQGINDQMAERQRVQGLAALRLRLRHQRQGHDDHPRRLGIFYDRPQGNQVFDMGGNAPGVLNSTVQWGTLQSVGAATGDPNPTLGLNPTGYDFIPPKVTQWNVGIQHKLASNLIFDLAYVGSKSDRPAAPAADQLGSARRHVPGRQPGPDACAERDAGRHGAPDRPAAALPGLRHHPDVGLHRLRQLPRPADVAEPPVRERVHVHVSTSGARRSPSRTPTSAPASRPRTRT